MEHERAFLELVSLGTRCTRGEAEHHGKLQHGHEPGKSNSSNAATGRNGGCGAACGGNDGVTHGGSGRSAATGRDCESSNGAAAAGGSARGAAVIASIGTTIATIGNATAASGANCGATTPRAPDGQCLALRAPAHGAPACGTRPAVPRPRAGGLRKHTVSERDIAGGSRE